jgi:hypothetical protein
MKSKSGVLTYDDFASLQRVGNAVTETLRLKSAPIIVRATQQPLSIGDYTVCTLSQHAYTRDDMRTTPRTLNCVPPTQVPAGHFLCLSPLWSQRDERLYPDPDAFKPDRWNVRHGLPSSSRLVSRYHVARADAPRMVMWCTHMCRASTRRGRTGSTSSPSEPASTAARASSLPTTYVPAHQSAFGLGSSPHVSLGVCRVVSCI